MFALVVRSNLPAYLMHARASKPPPRPRSPGGPPPRPRCLEDFMRQARPHPWLQPVRVKADLPPRPRFRKDFSRGSRLWLPTPVGPHPWILGKRDPKPTPASFSHSPHQRHHLHASSAADSDAVDDDSSSVPTLPSDFTSSPEALAIASGGRKHLEQ